MLWIFIHRCPSSFSRDNLRDTMMGQAPENTEPCALEVGLANTQRRTSQPDLTAPSGRPAKLRCIRPKRNAQPVLTDALKDGDTELIQRPTHAGNTLGEDEKKNHIMHSMYQGLLNYDLLSTDFSASPSPRSRAMHDGNARNTQDGDTERIKVHEELLKRPLMSISPFHGRPGTMQMVPANTQMPHVGHTPSEDEVKQKGMLLKRYHESLIRKPGATTPFNPKLAGMYDIDMQLLPFNPSLAYIHDIQMLPSGASLSRLANMQMFPAGASSSTVSCPLATATNYATSTPSSSTVHDEKFLLCDEALDDASPPY